MRGLVPVPGVGRPARAWNSVSTRPAAQCKTPGTTASRRHEFRQNQRWFTVPRGPPRDPRIPRSAAAHLRAVAGRSGGRPASRVRPRTCWKRWAIASGIGLAAARGRRPHGRVIVIDRLRKAATRPLVIVNPQLELTGAVVGRPEGCLSVPRVLRGGGSAAEFVKVRALDARWRAHRA